MYLESHPNESKYWRLQYIFLGKKRLIALGVYPEVSLKEAREKRDELKRIVKNGQDPAVLRKKRKIETKKNSESAFEKVAREWFHGMEAKWAKRHAFYIIRRLETHVFPSLEYIPIGQIEPKDLISVIKRIEDRGAIETAHRILQTVGQIFRYAIATGRAEHDITADLRGHYKRPKKTTTHTSRRRNSVNF